MRIITPMISPISPPVGALTPDNLSVGSIVAGPDSFLILRNTLKRNRTRQSGFSLLEILFGIGLVAILSVLIFTGAQAFQQRSRSIHCLGQLRTLWTGAMHFVAEHNGRFCSLNVERSCRDPQAPGFREYVGYTANLFESTVYSCPEAQRSPYAAGGNMNRSYSVNRLMVSNWALPDSGATVVRGAIEYYNRSPSLAEGLYLVDGVPNPGTTTSSGKGINYFSNINAANVSSLVALHGGRINAVYLDGHAASLQAIDLQRPEGNVLWGGSEQSP